ncbi:MAG: DinB family protein [Saprospiraceae bacterium]|nr:MAG: DinB family protein [Saprospiraceae bacterium]
MNCKQGTDIILRQIAGLLEKLDEDTYSRPLELFNGSSIGQHFRHILDFYDCLLKGLAAGRIDYTKRQRDLRMEQEPGYAAAILENLARQTESVEEATPVEILADFSSDFNEERPPVQSSAARELMYAYDHAVHHLAIIKMGLKVVASKVEAGPETGVAPSTLRYWKEQQSKKKNA